MRLLPIFPNLCTHAWIPEALQMQCNDADCIVGICGLIGGDVVRHFYLPFNMRRKLISTVHDALVMAVDDEIRAAHKTCQRDVADLGKTDRPCRRRRNRSE